MRRKRLIRLTENRLRGMIREAVKGVLNEGYQQMMYNDDGEPIGYDYVPDQYEQEEMEWEENMRRADDPMYAASQEAEEWYQRACRVFQDQGVNVPEDVKRALAKEMRRKVRKAAYKSAMAKMQPLVDAIRKMGYDADPYYESETPDTEAYYYIEVRKNGRRLSNEELRTLQRIMVNNGFDNAWDLITS